MKGWVKGSLEVDGIPSAFIFTIRPAEGGLLVDFRTESLEGTLRVADRGEAWALVGALATKLSRVLSGGAL